MSDFLVLRGADHVVLGVTWSGFARSSAADGTPVLTATGDARLVVVFPPQHVAEEASAPFSPAPLLLGNPPVPVWRAQLCGPSRVVVAVTAGDVVPLTAAGLLGALAGARLVTGSGATAIELPWRLLTEPVAGGPVRCAHPVDPVVADGVTGLWRTSVHGPAATASDAGLALRPVAGGPSDDPGFAIPLPAAERAVIAANAAVRPAAASRLDLSASGGTLWVDAAWDNVHWRHRAVLGRDLTVRTSTTGVLFPFGHRAQHATVTERIMDPAAGGAAVLRHWSVLTVTEPVRRPPADAAVRRAFPFDEVEITTRTFTDLVTPTNWQLFPTPAGVPLRTFFHPLKGDGTPLRFPVRFAKPGGDLHCTLPLIFVADLSPVFSSLTDPGLAQLLARSYRERVATPGTNLDVVRSANRVDGDVHEVHAMVTTGVLASDGYRPRLTELEVRLPALRSLLGHDRPSVVTFAERYLREGDRADVLFDLAQPIKVDFTARADRSGGLVSPAFTATALSRSLGPVNLAALPNAVTGHLDPKRLFPAEATLLGLPLRDLVTQVTSPPKITSFVHTGRPPDVTLRWEDVKLVAHGPFRPTPGSRLNLTATTSHPARTTCRVNDVALVLPPGPKPLLEVLFGLIEFTQAAGREPDLRIEGLKTRFRGVLQLLEELQDAVDLGTARKVLDVTSNGITARYALPVPAVATGAFSLRNVAVHTAVEVPFDGRPVRVSLSFGSKAAPFALSVLMFGGGGYLEIELDRDGLRRLEAALEFGAQVAVDFVVARGEVHALGGVRFTLERDGSVSLEGYLRIGGSVEVLGLVSVSIEVRIGLTYRSERKSLVGRATIVVEVDLTLWSDSVELDSGEWVLAGGSAPEALRGAPEGVLTASAVDEVDRWRRYRDAFDHAGRQP
ncbi:hypothetical protein [Saccharothrix stipae]